MFHRHGDRTSKSFPPANLTDLGYTQVYNSGQYYRTRYVETGASNKIAGLNTDIVLLSQIQASAPADNVIESSATGFLQGLYPPVGATISAQTLANGSTISAPMNGYQIVPISLQTTGASSENAGWLQSATSCNNAEISSNQYYYTQEYNDLLNSTGDFYQSILPVINGTFTSATDGFKNAYTSKSEMLSMKCTSLTLPVFDLINVAEIHNTSIPSNNLITPEVFLQLQNLANTHEFNLAYNASSPIRAIAGMVLAGQVSSFLNSTIAAAGKRTGPKFAVQFGAYGTITSLFGLTNMTVVDPMFYGIPGYASALTFELFTDSNYTGAFPEVDDLQVRLLWHNGSTTTGDDLTPEIYPMFGQSATSLAWTDFSSRMAGISVGSNAEWCVACGNTTGTCAGTSGASTDDGSDGTTDSNTGGSHMSNAVAGVIGAMITLGIIFGAEALILLLGGFRMVRKRAMRNGAGSSNDGAELTSVNVSPSKAWANEEPSGSSRR